MVFSFDSASTLIFQCFSAFKLSILLTCPPTMDKKPAPNATLSHAITTGAATMVVKNPNPIVPSAIPLACNTLSTVVMILTALWYFLLKTILFSFSLSISF